MTAQEEWPFEDAQNTAVVSTVSVMKEHQPVCLVCHDDGSWQFLGGGLVTMAEAMLVSLKQAVATDQSLLELADLPLGWQATRENAQSPWTRSRKDSD